MIIHISRITFSLLIILSSFKAFHPPPAQEDDDIRIIASMEYEYGSEMLFTAEIFTTTSISRAALYLRTSRKTLGPLFADLTPGDPARATIEYDIRDGPLPPFASVEYWWRIEFVDKPSRETVPTTFIYADNRYAWQFISDTPITVNWPQGDSSIGTIANMIAKHSLEKIRLELNVPSPPSMDIFLYPSMAHLQAGLRLGGTTLIEGHSDPGLGVILTFIPDGLDKQSDLERMLPHEITHNLLYIHMGENYVDLPVWLNEGLATMEELQPRPEYQHALQVATHDHSFYAMDFLCESFPTIEQDKHLAYGQSVSFVRYLKSTYGMEKILRLVDAYQEGLSCGEGVQHIFGRSFAQLETDWQRATFRPTELSSALQPLIPWAIIALAILIVFLIVILSLFPRPEQTNSHAK